VGVEEHLHGLDHAITLGSGVPWPATIVLCHPHTWVVL
jgi:hypothetical protein